MKKKIEASILDIIRSRKTTTGSQMDTPAKPTDPKTRDNQYSSEDTTGRRPPEQCYAPYKKRNQYKARDVGQPGNCSRVLFAGLEAAQN